MVTRLPTRWASLLLIVFCLIPLNVQAENRNVRSKLMAVGTQLIQMQYAYDLNPDCSSLGEARMVVISAPKGGSISSRTELIFPSYKADNPRAHCNERRIPSLAVYYQAREGFRGADNFVFAIIFHDGVIWKYNVEMNVL